MRWYNDDTGGMSCVGRYTVIFSQLTYSTFSNDKQEQALQVSDIKSGAEGSAIGSPSDMEGDEREELEIDEEKVASRRMSIISPIKNPPPENHLVASGKKKKSGACTSIHTTSCMHTYGLT